MNSKPSAFNAPSRFRSLSLFALILVLSFPASAIAQIVASYDGSYLPNDSSPPSPNTSWALYDNLGGDKIKPNDPEPGIATFLDNSIGGRVSIHDTLGDTPIQNKAWVYEFRMAVESSAGDSKPAFDIGVRDEGGSPGRTVMLGFFNDGIEFVNNTTYSGTGPAVTNYGVIGTGFHDYRVEKFFDGSGYRIQAYIDGVPQFADPIPYSSLPAQASTAQGFGYFSLTPGTSTVYLDELVLEVIPSAEDRVAGLVADIIALNLQQGIANSLDSKLSSALDALNDVNENNDASAVNRLYAVINYIEAQRGSKISNADADYLEDAVYEILDLL